ncbi:MAG TPA: type II toxin-antitoxin system RelE/ParE family toxin [Chitinophagaceae bacterium]|nr:type II toxin-antitoxin system RelE/ParE family toxin [Chitinophagaceae bacterium]
MIYSLKILTEASSDIKDITFFYQRISPLLAIRFISQVYDGFARITANPDAWFNLTKRVRRYRLSDFPYLILFFRESNDIIVFTVMHERRNPKLWKQRIRQR